MMSEFFGISNEEKLFNAIQNQNLKKCCKYLDICDINIRDHNNITLMHYAVETGNIDLCKLLITYGFTIDYEEETTPYDIASYYKHFDICQLFEDEIEKIHNFERRKYLLFSI
jgi:hypothetical protein